MKLGLHLSIRPQLPSKELNEFAGAVWYLTDLAFRAVQWLTFAAILFFTAVTIHSRVLVYFSLILLLLLVIAVPTQLLHMLNLQVNNSKSHAFAWKAISVVVFVIIVLGLGSAMGYILTRGLLALVQFQGLHVVAKQGCAK